MILGFKYPRSVRKWMREAQEAIDHNGAPIDDPVIPTHLKLYNKGGLTELGELVRAHQIYKENWFNLVNQFTAAFVQVASSDANTLRHWTDLHLLATAYHESSVMRSIMSEPFYQSKEALSEQLSKLTREASKKADNGSREDFLLLHRFLRDTWDSWPYKHYPANYTELVDRYVENPTYEDYLVGSLGPLEQARRSHSLNFLQLFVEKSGGIDSMHNRPRALTPAGTYFDEMELNTFDGIVNRLQQLSKGKNN
jgi:hypothetical protein